MADMTGAWLETMTWPEAKAAIDAGRPVIIPIGAIAKEHGPHLPLNTDYLVARALAEAVAAALPVLIAPVVGFGYYPAFVRYPGSQSLAAATFQAMLTETFAKFARDGVADMAVINTGVSTEAPLRIAIRDFYEQSGVQVHSADIRTLGARSRRLLQQRAGGHADEWETSVMLAVAPDTVRMDRARPDYGRTADEPDSVFYSPAIFSGDATSGADYSATGARGDPTLATAEKGRAFLADMAAELIAGLKLKFPQLTGTASS
jgi:creatinine amidohydrolase